MFVRSAMVAAAASAPSVELGLRERKRRATRERLIDAAIDLAAERGFAAVTIEQISQQADVSPRTFFNYFACKEAAILGLDDGTRQRLRASIASTDAQSPIDALHRALADLADLFEHDAPRWHARMALMDRSPELVAYQLRDLAEAESMLADALTDRFDRLEPRIAVLAVRLALSVLRTAWDDWNADAPAHPEFAAGLRAGFDDGAALLAARPEGRAAGDQTGGSSPR